MDIPKKPLLNAVLRGSLFALAGQSVFTMVLLAAQHAGRGGIALVGLGSFAITSISGFLIVVRHAPVARAITIGVVYFPTMFGLMFFEAMYLDAKMYGNTF